MIPAYEKTSLRDEDDEDDEDDDDDAGVDGAC